MELTPHDGVGNRYIMVLSAPQGGVAQMVRNPEGNWVPYADYAILQEELEKFRALACATPFKPKADVKPKINE